MHFVLRLVDSNTFESRLQSVYSADFHAVFAVVYVEFIVEVLRRYLLQAELWTYSCNNKGIHTSIFENTLGLRY